MFVPVIPVVLSVSELQLLLSHLAILFVLMPPVVVNTPPINNAPFSLNFIVEIGPFVPELKANQELPSHLAILFTSIPFMVVKSPAINRVPSGDKAVVSIVPSISLPIDAHSSLVFKVAKSDTLTLPAEVNEPPI